MEIKVRGAYENNLKHISVDLPLYQITGLTGVSGSGKSTLLRNVLAASGSGDYTKVQTKTVRDALQISDFVKAESVSHMPLSIFIASKNVVSNPMSTVSTVSGIQELLRNLFTGFGKICCPDCGRAVSAVLPASTVFAAELIADDRYEDSLQYLQKRGEVISQTFFNQRHKIVKPGAKSAALASVMFTLRRATDSIIRDFHKQFNGQIMIADGGESYDPLLSVRCSCGKILPRISRSRFSFAAPIEEGGGACRHCGGSGSIVSIDRASLIQDETMPVLQGGIRFVTEKGLSHTTVTERFIQAAAGQYGIDLTQPVGQIPEDKMMKLLYGSEDALTFQDRIGGKKCEVFRGIATYLSESYIRGKGGTALAAYCTRKTCPECGGTRMDRAVDCFCLFGKTISQLLSMTLEELHNWTIETEGNADARVYLERLRRKTGYFCRVSCGHLSLDRSSSTLSGGELQRLRICAMLNSSLNRLCYLLDEPSSGLHASEIESMGNLLRELCAQGNTVIMVEHNKSLLHFCDYIVDLGPLGGSAGGNLLFSDRLFRVGRYDTATANLLTGKSEAPAATRAEEQALPENHITFAGLTQNNLKNITLSFPKGIFSVICGISGSGKSTILRDVILKNIGINPSAFGFQGVNYLGQGSGAVPVTSTVSTLLKLSGHIAKLFSSVGKLNPSCYMPNSKEGKCPICEGKGVLVSKNGENIGICNACHGKCYSSAVLEVKFDGINIDDMLNSPLDQLGSLVHDKKLTHLSLMCDLLGIGYLTLSRKSRTLSAGELQRVRLAYSLSVSQEKQQLYLLDEPSRGLHDKDSGKLARAIHMLVDAGNTVIAVEHNARLIAESDYLVELGGTGSNGGHLLYSGFPSGLMNTPTAEIFHPMADSCPDLFPGQAPSVEPPFEYLHFEADQIRDIARRTVDEYLSVAIPNNVFFSRAHSTQLAQGIPYLQIVDFAEPIRYDISLYSALGIRETVIACGFTDYPKEGELLRYVLNDESPTGKCSRCDGSGEVALVDQDFFVENGNLTKPCLRFLQNSTCYKAAGKVLKSDYGLNITKPLSEMSDMEWQTLFWGWKDPMKISGKTIYWRGIMASFLQNHGHYPDPMADHVYVNRRKEPCPVCGGKLLQPEFQKLKFYGMTYAELLSRPVKALYQETNNFHCRTSAEARFCLILSLLMEAGLEDLVLSESISRLNSCSAALVRWISLYGNRIADICIVADHWRELNRKTIAFLEKTAADWRNTNPVQFI